TQLWAEPDGGRTAALRRPAPSAAAAETASSPRPPESHGATRRTAGPCRQTGETESPASSGRPGSAALLRRLSLRIPLYVSAAYLSVRTSLSCAFLPRGQCSAYPPIEERSSCRST